MVRLQLLGEGRSFSADVRDDLSLSEPAGAAVTAAETAADR
jgi:hypothetical protein